MAAEAAKRRGGRRVTHESLHIGRFLGVDVGVNWSMLLVFWLISWSLADGLFPAAAEGGSAAAYWGAALISAVLFYVSLLLHELAHSVLARRNGIAVEGITLWLFGGVSRLRGEAATPRAELRIAAIGPLVSLAVAVVAAVVGAVLRALGAPALVIAAAIWLATVNGMLAVFNLVPAFPLDGGRVLRAQLWRRRGNRIAATQAAARVGVGFGWVLMAVGVVELLVTGRIGGLWLVFLGWFLVGAARGEASQSVLREALRDVRVADVMSRDPVQVPDWIVLQELLDSYATQHRFTSFPVRDFDGRPSGLVMLPQVRTVPAERRRDVRVRDVMWRRDEVPTARADEPLVDLLERMGNLPATRALVLDHDHLLGIVSPSDVARMMQLASLRTPTSSRAAAGRFDDTG